MSILKTLYFNFHYFGFQGLFILPVLIGKHVELRELKGKVICEIFKTAAVQIGLTEMGNFPMKTTTASIQNKGSIVFKGRSILGVGTRICNSGTLTMGNNAVIMANGMIICAESITIGNEVMISWNVNIMDTDFHKIYIDETKNLLNPNKPIILGDNIWICNAVTIMKGVSIGNNNVIASNSVIRKPVPNKNCIIGDNGKIIKENIRWEL